MLFFIPERFLRETLGQESYDSLCGFRAFISVLFLPYLCIPLLCSVAAFCYWPINELILESNYRQKYGAAWKVEFERYHGTLAHAHMQIWVCVAALVALTAVFGFALHVFRRKHR